MTKTNFPMQPLVWDDDDVIRFRENRIVSFLLEAGPFDMNQLAAMPFDQKEREQFAQLIGYSASGFGELSYCSDHSVTQADELADEMIEVRKESVVL